MKIFSFFNYKLLFLFIFTFFSINSLASVVISGTRVIYLSDSKEVSVKINNVGSSPVLLQSWIDYGDVTEDPTNINVPFILTPAINRVEPSKAQTLRIRYIDNQDKLPNDRESVFWLNVLEVPAVNESKSNDNRLQMAFRSRIKLFYRPIGLDGNPNDIVNNIVWTIENNKVKAFNPTPYYASLVDISVNKNKMDFVMIAPKSSIVTELLGNKNDFVNGISVNDYGGLDTFNSKIK